MESALLVLYMIGLVIIAYTDLTSYTIPNKVLLILLALGVVYRFVIGGVLTMLIGFSMGFLIAYIAWFMEGLGGGDVKLMAIMGIWLGHEKLFAVIFIASIVGLIWSFVDFLSQKRLKEKLKSLIGQFKAMGVIGIKGLNVKNKDLRKPIPFGTCLSIATILFEILLRK